MTEFCSPTFSDDFNSQQNRPYDIYLSVSLQGKILQFAAKHL